ncbi:hypothetical protein MTO96_022584 [Rhipicephalus appendiculatus]
MRRPRIDSLIRLSVTGALSAFHALAPYDFWIWINICQWIGHSHMLALSSIPKLRELYVKTVKSSEIAVTDCNQSVLVILHADTMAEFQAKDFGLSFQKKLLGRVSSKSVAKAFIDDTSASLLDNLYKLVKSVTGSKKDAEKVTKNIIKIVVKVGILHRNNQFSAEEMKVAKQLQHKMRALAMAVSLGRIDYVFGFFGKPETLDSVFASDSVHRECLGRIVKDLHEALDKESL